MNLLYLPLGQRAYMLDVTIGINLSLWISSLQMPCITHNCLQSMTYHQVMH